MLAAYHRAFSAELRDMVRTLPIAGGNTVLDMARGDGVYSPWLADLVGSSGRVIAVDLIEYLKSLSARIAVYLDAPMREAFTALVDPFSAKFLLNDPDLTATFIDYVVWGRKP